MTPSLAYLSRLGVIIPGLCQLTSFHPKYLMSFYQLFSSSFSSLRKAIDFAIFTQNLRTDSFICISPYHPSPFFLSFYLLKLWAFFFLEDPDARKVCIHFFFQKEKGIVGVSTYPSRLRRRRLRWVSWQPAPWTPSPEARRLRMLSSGWSSLYLPSDG